MKTHIFPIHSFVYFNFSHHCRRTYSFQSRSHKSLSLLLQFMSFPTSFQPYVSVCLYLHLRLNILHIILRFGVFVCKCYVLPNIRFTSSFSIFILFKGVLKSTKLNLSSFNSLQNLLQVKLSPSVSRLFSFCQNKVCASIPKSLLS